MKSLQAILDVDKIVVSLEKPLVSFCDDNQIDVASPRRRASSKGAENDSFLDTRPVKKRLELILEVFHGKNRSLAHVLILLRDIATVNWSRADSETTLPLAARNESLEFAAPKRQAFSGGHGSGARGIFHQVTIVQSTDSKEFRQALDHGVPVRIEQAAGDPVSVVGGFQAGRQYLLETTGSNHAPFRVAIMGAPLGIVAKGLHIVRKSRPNDLTAPPVVCLERQEAVGHRELAAVGDYRRIGGTTDHRYRQRPPLDHTPIPRVIEHGQAVSAAVYSTHVLHWILFSFGKGFREPAYPVSATAHQM